MFFALLDTIDFLGFMGKWRKGGFSFGKNLKENAD
jgi:hypothetical protein